MLQSFCLGSPSNRLSSKSGCTKIFRMAGLSKYTCRCRWSYWRRPCQIWISIVALLSPSQSKIFRITMRERRVPVERVPVTKASLCKLSVQRVHEWTATDLGERVTKHWKTSCQKWSNSFLMFLIDFMEFSREGLQTSWQNIIDETLRKSFDFEKFWVKTWTGGKASKRSRGHTR